MINEVISNAALIEVGLHHFWFSSRWVDHMVNNAADIVYCFGLKIWWGRTKIHPETTKYIVACNINDVINVSCITCEFCSTYWTNLLQDPMLTSFPGQQTRVDGHCGNGLECQAEFMNPWFLLHTHLSDAIEVCLVNNPNNFSCFKLRFALLNWVSRQQLNKKGTWNLSPECLWGM